MLCPKDLVQMHQLENLGGGESTDDSYITFEVKECPTCGRKILEYYEALVLTLSEVMLIKRKILTPRKVRLVTYDTR